MNVAARRVASASCFLSLVSSVALAGDITSWQRDESAAWHEGPNWSGGEPVASSTAIVTGGTCLISMAGEMCNVLQIGDGGASGTVIMQAGELTVVTELRAGSSSDVGTFSQLNGTVTTPSLVALGGGYIKSGGTLTAAVVQVGDGTGLGSMSINGVGVFDVSGSLTVAPGATLQFANGTNTIGDDAGDELIVDGGISTVNFGSTTVQHLRLNSDTAFFLASPSSFGLPTITVIGTFTQDGRLQILDLDAPEGRYDVVTAGAIAGAFDTFDFPPGWTSGVDGTTLWIEKGGMPVEPATWTDVKEAFARD